MTQRTRRKIDATLKAKIALEALREHTTVADLAQRGLEPNGATLRLSSSPCHCASTDCSRHLRHAFGTPAREYLC